MGENQYNLVDVNFHHIVLEGSGYEVGNQLAKFINQDPSAKQFFSSGKLDLKKLGFSDFNTLWAYCEKCCPGITEEIQGFADGLETTPEEVPFWGWTFGPSLGGNCSQLAVLSSATIDNHIYLGRSYEWIHTEEDLKLITTRIKGKAHHIGFSCLLFGRHDGLNEHGLLVSMTGGGIFGVPFKHRGPMFWLAIRSILDQCASVEDALTQLQTQPMAGYFSLILVDKQDSAALVEFADSKVGIKRITQDDFHPYLFSVNHFRLPEIKQHNELNCGIITHSQKRASLITEMIQNHTPQISKENIKSLFATEHPKGLCNHFYNEQFGTLWSMIFDVTQGSVDVCFSAPTHNKYRSFKLDNPVGITEYPAIVPIKLNVGF